MTATATTTPDSNVLQYRGSNFLKQRLVLATLSGRPIRITDIRNLDTEPGLRGYEISLIRLLDKCSNGSRIDINQTGTQLYYSPGLLNGGPIQHTCSLERGIGYYLDVLIALGPFCKVPITAVLRGITNSPDSPSVDYIRGSALPMLKRFLLVDDGLELKCRQRGLAPLGGGEVLFRCPVRKTMRAVQCDKPGMVKRVRGTVYAAKVSPAMANRTLEAAKGVLLGFLPDVYIYSDQTKGRLAGNSPGFGITLTAETTEGVCFSAEAGSVAPGERSASEGPTVPEDLGRRVAQQLLEEIYRGGCVDSSFQWIAALYMALGQKDVSKFLTGPLTLYTIQFLQHLREFFNMTFKLDNPRGSQSDEPMADGEADADDADDRLPGANKVLMACIGIGYVNMNKRTN